MRVTIRLTWGDHRAHCHFKDHVSHKHQGKCLRGGMRSLDVILTIPQGPPGAPGPRGPPGPSGSEVRILRLGEGLQRQGHVFAKKGRLGSHIPPSAPCCLFRAPQGHLEELVSQELWARR